MAKKKGEWKRILSYIGPYLFFVIMSVIFAALSALCTLLIPVFSGKAIDFMVGGNVNFSGVLLFILKIGIAALIGAVSQQLLAICNNRITYSVSRDLRNEMAKKIHRLPLSFLDSHPTGDLVGRMTADVDTFSDGLLMGFTQLFSGIITILGILIIMFYYNVSITLIVVILTPLSLFTASFIAGKTHRYFTDQAAVRGEETALINEIIDSERVINAYNRSDSTVERFDKVNERLKSAAFKATFFSSLTNPSTRLVNNIVYAAVSLVAALFGAGYGLSIGKISVFLSYASQYAKPFNEISGVVTELQNAMASIRRVFALLDEKEEVPDSEDAYVLSDASTVSLDSVYFSYVPDKPLIENVSLDVKKGERIAIVGPTGCGKTTLINLLMRFYDVGKGSIRVDGKDIRTCTRKSLRQSFGMVLQDTWLKSGTVRDNIAYGKPDATDDEITAAAKNAHAHSFIRRLPDGYNTHIVENGDNLSAGQKQLLCIARIMLCLPPMLILDEATSSIDTRTEIKIQSAFSELMKGRTSFIVAHRLSTIREANLILVMKDGNIIEQGTHSELLKKEGFYANLYNSQFASEE